MKENELRAFIILYCLRLGSSEAELPGETLKWAGKAQQGREKVEEGFDSLDRVSQRGTSFSLTL